MTRIEKTVFVSYRRTSIPWALAVFQNLTHHGFDVFVDYLGIASGTFEEVILGNIRSRAHFLVLLTPSALERCDEPGDLFRREIEEAIQCRRNVVPMMFETFDFGAPGIASRLTGGLAALKQYNGLGVPPEYFEAAMAKLRDKFLNISLDAVVHPSSDAARIAAAAQQTAAVEAPPVPHEELAAYGWVERGFGTSDLNEKLLSYDEAIRLKPDYAMAYYNRGVTRRRLGDLEGAVRDYNNAIRIKPDYADAYNNRGTARHAKGDLDGARKDYDEAIRLQPDLSTGYNNRAITRRLMGDLDGAKHDFAQARRIEAGKH